MESQADYNAPPQPESSPKKQGFRAIWILWGCGGMFALFLLAIGGLFVVAKVAMNKGEKEFNPVCERYFAKVQANDYKAAYSDFAPAMKAVLNESDYIALDRGIHERLGALKSKSVEGVQTGVDIEGRWGEIIYKGEFEKGPGTIRIRLRKYGQGYEMIGFNYNSPILANAIMSKKP